MSKLVKPFKFADIEDAPGEDKDTLYQRLIKNTALIHTRELEKLKVLLPRLSKKQISRILLAILQEIDEEEDKDGKKIGVRTFFKTQDEKEVFKIAQLTRNCLFQLFIDGLKRTAMQIKDIREKMSEEGKKIQEKEAQEEADNERSETEH